MLIDKFPSPRILAIIDYKTKRDDITFTEVIAYNQFVAMNVPVYIVQGDAETGEFEIFRYIDGHHAKPTFNLEKKTETKDWKSFEKWERALREYSRRKNH